VPAQESRRVFTAAAGEVPAMVDYVLERAELAGVGPKRLAHLGISIEEIALNICNHAFSGAEGEVAIVTSDDGEQFIAELSDDGRPFDPRHAPKADVESTLRTRRVGGLGVLLVGRLMDDFRYRRSEDRNIVTLSIRKAGETGA